MSERENGRRLPPPAFPPGSRRHAPRAGAAAKTSASSGSVDDAFISPDEPLPERIDPMGSAFISPDEPIPERKIELLEEFRGEGEVEPGEEGVVVGMDLEAHLEATEVASGGDPHVMELSEAIAKLAEALRTRGEAGLRVRPEMSRFEATLRAYCVGYLAGRRAEEPPAPIVEEPLPTDG
jgi:hypothetical protein